MDELRLAENLALPAIETAVQRLAFIGTTGSGKTYAAMKLAERMWWAGIPFVALDVMGIWYGLRVPAAGLALGSVVIFGGRHGDVAITEDDGALVAETINARNLSAVVDLSELDTNAAKARFAAAFAKRMYDLHKAKRRALHLFLEEAHEYLPQNPERGDAVMLGHWNRLWKQGRNFGLGGSLISQRPQDLNKKALDLTALVLAFNTTGSNAVEAMAKWMGKPETVGIQELQPGECIAWSPSWLKIQARIKIERRQTAHVSFDPLDPLDPQAAPAPDDRLPLPREEMAEIREAFEKPVDEKAPAPKTETVVTVERKQYEAGLLAEIERLRAEIASMSKAFTALKDRVREAIDITPWELTGVDETKGWGDENRKAAGLKPLPVIYDSPPVQLITPKAELPDTKVTVPQQAILDTLANLLAIKTDPARKDIVALFSGASPTSSSYTNNLGRLRTLGLIDYPTGGFVAITGEGNLRAKASAQPLTLSEFRKRWFGLITGPQARIMAVLVQKNRAPVEKAELARLAGASPESSSYTNNLGRLRSLGMIDYPKRGLVAATSLLFPEGLR